MQPQDARPTTFATSNNNDDSLNQLVGGEVTDETYDEGVQELN